MKFPEDQNAKNFVEDKLEKSVVAVAVLSFLGMLVFGALAFGIGLICMSFLAAVGLGIVVGICSGPLCFVGLLWLVTRKAIKDYQKQALAP